MFWQEKKTRLILHWQNEEHCLGSNLWVSPLDHSRFLECWWHTLRHTTTCSVWGKQVVVLGGGWSFSQRDIPILCETTHAQKYTSGV